MKTLNNFTRSCLGAALLALLTATAALTSHDRLEANHAQAQQRVEAMLLRQDVVGEAVHMKPLNGVPRFACATEGWMYEAPSLSDLPVSCGGRQAADHPDDGRGHGIPTIDLGALGLAPELK